MKVLITTDLYKSQINGVVTSVLNLYTELKELGVDVRILTLSKTMKSYNEGDVYFISSFPVNIYPDIRASIAVKDKYLKELINWAPDIIHTQCEFSTLIFAKIIAKKVKCPIVHTYHTMYESCVGYIFKNERMGKKLISKVMKQLLKKCDRIIAPTKKVKKNLERYKIKNDISIIPTGIDLFRFETDFSKEEILELKSDINIPEDDFVILFLGRIAKEKNIDELIRHYNNLSSKRSNISFLIVGDGPYLEILSNKVNTLKNKKVFFTGMVDPSEVYKYYKLADVFVCASKSETQGLTFVEAAANSLPLVCKYDSCLDGLLINGKDGYFFNSGQDFEKSILKLADDENLRREFALNAKEISKKYSKEYFAKSVYDLYEEVISNYRYIPTVKRRVYKVKKATKRQFRKLKGIVNRYIK
ncbi:glycosyltransferase family 4 protein [Peptoniphilus mikwangii]|uniref:glycosyltransferase family 4 protein n=1 Tax=Peptoniphilus mikwangii TaxID=1354300 RepID=UPI00041742A5|nr:glycosyltransferase family 4 protein [Peptoniphilus mikwangii]